MSKRTQVLRGQKQLESYLLVPSPLNEEQQPTVITRINVGISISAIAREFTGGDMRKPNAVPVNAPVTRG